MSDQKTIYILRHAKAETGASYQDDHERKLSQRGCDAARAIGYYLARQSIRPDMVICSTATRARETWDCVLETYSRDVQVEYSDRLYLASANETMQLMAQTPETISRLLLVGHNPGLHQFCLKLAQAGAASLLDTLAIKFPTCAFATIALGRTSWRDIAQTKGELKGFVTPSMLTDILEE
jgi:phosphohistidine phosphatase